MDIDELALKVAKRFNVTMQGCSPVAFARALIAEYEAAGSEPFCYLVGSYDGYEEANEEFTGSFPVYLRPDPRVAELEVEATKWKEGYRKEFVAAIDWAGRHQILREQVAEIEAKLADREGLVCGDCDGSGWLENRVEGKHPCTCMTEAEPYQLLEAQNAALLVTIEAINGIVFSRPLVDEQWQLEILDAISPSAELLEARDRKRDAKLLTNLAAILQTEDEDWILVKQYANKRESGEWKPELGD